MSKTPQRQPESESRTEQWPLSPLVSVADLPDELLPTVRIPEERYHPLRDHGRRRVENGAHGTIKRHQQGILGEGAVAMHFGVPEAVDTNLYERGDGGVDLRLNGVTVDVKTAGRHRSEPALTVDAYQELRADYYLLAHRVGETTIRLVGYCPRQFVANAPIWEYKEEQYHRVPREDLFPVPQLLL